MQTLWTNLGTQELLCEAARVLSLLAQLRQREHVLSQQLRFAALEMLPILLTGADVLLKEGAACSTEEMLQFNYKLAALTVVCAWLSIQTGLW